jgi:hypothetical protein
MTMTSGVSAVFEKLIHKLKQRGQSEADIVRAIDSQGDGLIEKIADTVTQATHSPRETFPLTVNYDLPLADAVDAGNYQGVHRSITRENFPSCRHGQAQLEMTLVRYEQRMDSESVLRELDREGLRAAELPELLAFGETYPEVQRRFSVVGLGSVWKDRKGYRNVPCLYEASEARYLDLHWWDDGWYSYSRFAAIRR